MCSAQQLQEGNNPTAGTNKQDKKEETYTSKQTLGMYGIVGLFGVNQVQLVARTTF